METRYIVGLAAFVVVALFLVHYKPAGAVGIEGFATVAVDINNVPACVERSTDAQKLLARFSSIPESDAAASELRLLVSKLCCMEADIATPAAGTYRTMSLQYRTSHDTEPPSSIVGRCLRQAVNRRDIDIIIEKMEVRGHALIKQLLGGDCGDAKKEFGEVVARTKLAMVTTCLGTQPSMDRPLGARDMAFWETDTVADLAQYQGISAASK
jgi:hypothetical protein